jgi:hypothetical protein
MKIILALALIVALGCAAEVIVGGSRSGLGGYGGYGGYGNYGYDGLRGDSWRGDSFRGDVIRGDAYRGDLGFGGSYGSRAWSGDFNGDGIVDWRDDFGLGGVRQRSGDFVRADWNGDGIIDANDGWRSLDTTYRGDSWRGDGLVGDAWRGDTWRGDSWRGDGLVGDAWRGDSWRGDGLYGDSWRGDGLVGDSWRGDSWRGDLGWNGARSGLGYETGLGGYRSGYGSLDRSWDAPVYGGSFGGAYNGGWDRPVRGDAWRGDSWRGDWGYETPRVVQAGSTQAKVVTKPAATTTTKAKTAK